MTDIIVVDGADGLTPDMLRDHRPRPEHVWNGRFNNAHLPDQCIGEHCTLHNRSDHSMREFPQHWRGDRGIMERICPHGVGHPDPDDYRIINGEDSGIHGCDGCCSE